MIVHRTFLAFVSISFLYISTWFSPLLDKVGPPFWVDRFIFGISVFVKIKTGFIERKIFEKMNVLEILKVV